MTVASSPSGLVEAHPPSISLRQYLAWFVVAFASFHAAQISGLGWLLIPCAYALIELSRASTNRKTFYPTLALGFLFYAPQLAFFWNIFNAAAIALWLVLAFWLALFTLSLRLVRVRFGNSWMLLLAPVLWTGLEYFRSELYYLRFSWLTFGMAHHGHSSVANLLGMYALGFITVALASATNALRFTRPRLALPCLAAITMLMASAGALLRPSYGNSDRSIPVAGVQLEFPSDGEVINGLERARVAFPDAELFMLSEYTFQAPVPPVVRDWCATHQVHLVVGGKEPLGETNFYNMAYVIGPNGAIVHQQVKSVPIQFFKDGLPAPERKVWDSPWGKLGVLTCYDLSYTRIVDDFARQGAIALLNPTMDVADWGAVQHVLHARVAPVRAAEYQLPIFRVASSGVSQIVDAAGHVLSTAPFPGEGALIGGQLPLHGLRPHVPFMNRVAPFCSVLAGFALLAALIPSRKKASTPSESPH
jgi:apolipoprotein N-acyltransferase